MKLQNVISGSEPLVLHKNGEAGHRIWDQAQFCFRPQKQQLPCDLTIITWNSRDRKGCLEKSLDELGLPYISLWADNWKTSMKIALNVSALKFINTEYTMAIDSFDAMLLSSDSVIERFLSEDCDILFSGETNSYPRVPHLTNFEDKLSDSPFRYLNSGGWIGNTQFCRQYFEKCDVADPTSFYRHDNREIVWNDDQGRTRLVFQTMFPRAKIDYRCNIFQCLYGVTDEVKLTSPLLYL